VKKLSVLIIVTDPATQRGRRVQVGAEYDLSEEQAREAYEEWKTHNPSLRRDMVAEYTVRIVL
jgi:hypothetical protein